MDFLPVAGAVLALVVALVLARFIGNGEPPSTAGAQKQATLEGLRGWLAALVFLCHAQAWYDVAHHRGWGGGTRGRQLFQLGQPLIDDIGRDGLIGRGRLIDHQIGDQDGGLGCRGQRRRAGGAGRNTSGRGMPTSSSTSG